VELKIVNGRVKDIEFRDHCTGESYEVEASVRECIRRSVATWRYAVWPVCQGEESLNVDFLYLTPPHQSAVAESSTTLRSCGK
jgi:hypothetical protein